MCWGVIVTGEDMILCAESWKISLFGKSKFYQVVPTVQLYLFTILFMPSALQIAKDLFYFLKYWIIPFALSKITWFIAL